MYTFGNPKHMSTKTLQVVALVVLTHTIHTAQAYYSIQSEHGKQTWFFPEARGPTYLERLALPGQIMAAHKANVAEVETEDLAEDVAKLLETIQSFYLLYSGKDIKSSNKEKVFEEAAVLDSILYSLAALEESGASSSTCVNDTGRLIISMFERQGWALKFLDAAGKPGPGLSELRTNLVGDYDLCRSLVANNSAAFKGNYVTWKTSVGPVNPINPTATLMIQWGVCMPDSCTDKENTQFVFEALQLLGLNGTLQVVNAESHTDHREVTAATVVAIIIICIIGTLMFVGTLYDVFILQLPRWREEWRIEDVKSILNMPASNSTGSMAASSSSHSQNNDDDDDPLIIKKDEQEPSVATITPAPTGTFAKVLVAFSVYTNGSKVLNTTQQPGSISCVHGIRFLSMSWVILGHTFAFCLSYVDNLTTEIPRLLQRWTFDTVANAFVSVDSFFTLSGLLVSYLTVKEMDRRGWRLKWGLFYFHRFWRLTPPYMLVIVLLLGLQQYMGQGPLWESVQPQDKAICEDNWWANLLYINNFFSPQKMCLGQSWYLANDMQFFVVSPLMIIPFYFNEVFGFVSCGIFFLVHVITTLALSVHHKWPATMITLQAGGGDLENYFKDYYGAPWCRIGPYVVGIVTGYLLAARRDRIKLTWATATIGWSVALAVALAVVYGLRGDIGAHHPSTVAVAALYNALARSAWAASLCWVIVACVTGWGGFVNTLLSWSPFVVLGRLTYMTFLIHLAVISIFFGNQQTLFHFTSFNIAMTFISIVVLSYGASFVLILGLESPMIGLEKVFLPQRKRD